MTDGTDRLGGPFNAGTAIALVAWFLFAVPLVISGDAAGEQIALAVGIATLAIIPSLAFGAVLYVVLIRVRPARQHWIVHAARGASGALAGLLLSLLADAAGISIDLPTWALVMIFTAATPWLLATIDNIRDIRQQVLDKRELLVNEAAKLMSTRSTQRELVEDVRATIISSVEVELESARQEVSRQIAALQSLSRDELPGSGSLKDAAHDSVRSLARGLDASQAVKPDPIGVIGTIRSIVQTQPFHPAPLAVIYAAINLPALVQSRGSTQGIIDVILGVGLIFLILLSGNALMRSGRFRHDVIFIATFAVLQVPTVLFFLLVSRETSVPLLDIATSVIISFLLVMLTSSLGSWEQRQQRAQRTFQELLSDETIETLARTRIAADEARQAAQTLHGPVQARLAACAVAMDQAAAAGDLDRYRESLARAQDALESPLFPDADPIETSIEESVLRSTGLWAGLLEVTVEIATELASTPDSGGRIESIVEEAVGNAARHGRAKRLQVRISDAGDSTVIEVQDDGIGFSEFRPGLGSRLFDKTTGGHWSVTPGSALGGCAFRAEVTRA